MEEKNKDKIVESPTLEKKSISKKKIAFITLISLVVIALVVVLGILIKKNNDKKMERENAQRIERIKDKKDDWKNNAIVTPKAGSLQAAGYITICWESAEELDSVKGYKVYVNDELIKETDGKTTTCEYYTTEVRSHTVYVEADLEHGSVINSDIVTFFVNKKGLCVNTDMARKVKADEWGVSWYYNWALEAFNYTSFQELQYVPMIWSRADSNREQIEMLELWDYKYILAYNEPDRPDQANMTIDDAVEGMQDFMNQSMLVGTPATALLPPWSDEWFQPFMEKLEEKNIEIDFIPIHHYWNWYDEEGVKAFLELVDQTWEMYHKPIWITEFAITGDPGKDDMQRQSVIDYMKGVLPELDKREYVERYAWFSFSPTDVRNGGSALMHHYEGYITDLGYVYQELGMPEGYGDENFVTVVENTKKDIIK